MPLVYFETFQLVLVAEINYFEFIGKTQKINEIHRNKLQIIDLPLIFCARKSWKPNGFHGFYWFSTDFYWFFDSVNYRQRHRSQRRKTTGNGRDHFKLTVTWVMGVPRSVAVIGKSVIVSCSNRKSRRKVAGNHVFRSFSDRFRFPDNYVQSVWFLLQFVTFFTDHNVFT